MAKKFVEQNPAKLAKIKMFGSVRHHLTLIRLKHS